MSVVTIRANHNSYSFDQTGGTRDPRYEVRDAIAFMDAVVEQRTKVLDSVSKGAATTEQRPRWGFRSVTPRGSVVGATLADTDTSVTLPGGHTARFQQGHLLQITRASDGEVEYVWVNDDPGQTAMTIDRGIGSTALDFEVGDRIVVVGIGMPEMSDFPQAPVSRGYEFYNEWQTFSKSIVHSLESDKMPSVDNPGGGLMSKDMLQLAKDIKMDLDRSLLFGRRRAGDPSPAGPKPSFMGGIIQFAELSGNVYTLGGSGVLLSASAVRYVQHDMDDKYGANAATNYVMSWNTKQIFNNIASPLKFNNGITGNSVDERWETFQTDVGRISFSYMQDFPDGLIVGYNASKIKYHPFEGADWKEKDFPTKGFYSWKGIGGKYTVKSDELPGMFIIKGFDTNQAHYPNWDNPQSFMV